MYAQLTFFDGPRTPEQLAAADFGGRERIHPAVGKLGHRLSVYILRRDDGSEIVLAIADSKQALLDVQKAIMSTELLPGEDPADRPGQDRAVPGDRSPRHQPSRADPKLTGYVPPWATGGGERPGRAR